MSFSISRHHQTIHSTSAARGAAQTAKELDVIGGIAKYAGAEMQRVETGEFMRKAIHQSWRSVVMGTG
jgi:hypothetical protein